MSAEAPERSSGRHLSIGEVLAQLRGEFPDITISKIRFLESQGLIDPERTPSGYRKFYPPDLERLRWILYQQRDHFLPLRVIKDRLDAYGPEGAPATDSEQRASGNGPGGASRPTEPPPAARPERTPSPPRPPSPRPDDRPERTADSDVPATPARPEPSERARPTEPERPHLAPSEPPAERPAPSAPAVPSVPHQPPSLDRPSPAETASRAQHPAGVERPAATAPAPAPAPEQPPPSLPTPPAPPAPPVAAVPTAAPPRESQERPATPPRREPPRPEPRPKPPLPFDDFVDDAEDRDEKLGTIRRSDSEPTGTHLTRAELLEATGLTDARLDALEEFGIVVPLMGDGAQAQYDDEALSIAEIGAGFYSRGIEARHLKMYWHFAEREGDLFGRVLIGYVRQRNPAARARLQEDLEDLARLGRRLRTAMLRRALGESLSE